MYGYLADFVVFLHVLYVGYVVLGQVVVVVAGTFRRQWGRNPWFRFTHLAAIAYVAYEAIMDIRCPLTVWEEKLRAMDGTSLSSAGETFVGRLLHNLLFVDQYFTDGRPPEAFFTTLYIATLVVVVQALLLYPPRWFRFKSRMQAKHEAKVLEPVA